MRFHIEIRPFTELEMSDRGISGTDVACAIAVDGRIIGYTDDYGTATIIPSDLDGQLLKPVVEALVEAAGDVYTKMLDGEPS